MATLSAGCGERAAPDAALASWRVDSAPLLEIRDDNPDGEVMLGAAAHVTRLPDGGVLVSDRGLYALRRFAPDGRLLGAVGRQGTGPGEFEYIRFALRCGDSLFVEDIVARRVTVHALDGTIGRMLPTSEFGGGLDAYRSACNADGTFVHHAWNRFDPEKIGRHRQPVAVWLASAAGQRIADLAPVPGEEFIGFGDGGARALLRRTPQLAIGRRHAYVGTADSGVVEVYTLDGVRSGVRRLPEADQRATDADLERAKRLDSMGQTADAQAQSREQWALDTPPSTLPAYDALMVDADDHLWVRRYPRAGAADTPWIVFDPDGAPVATVMLPAVLTVHEVGRNYIVGVVLDPASGMHAVRVLALARTPRE